MKATELSVGDCAAIAAAVIAALGIFATIWLTLVAMYRAETRNLIDRIGDQLELIQEIVGEVWMSPDPYTAPKLRLAEARLTHAGNRLDVLVSVALKKVHVVQRKAVRNQVASIIDRATLGIEGLADDVESADPGRRGITEDDHKARYFEVHRAATSIVHVLEGDFERWPRKVLWW